MADTDTQQPPMPQDTPPPTPVEDAPEIGADGGPIPADLVSEPLVEMRCYQPRWLGLRHYTKGEVFSVPKQQSDLLLSDYGRYFVLASVKDDPKEPEQFPEPGHALLTR